MRIGYTTAADAAREIGNVWGGRRRKAYTWPYNRFKWEDSETWWVVPAPDKVAFQYAKIIATLSPRVASAGQLFVGLYVEKGVSQSAASTGVYPDDWIIGPTWRWHAVLRDLRHGAFQSAVAHVSRNLAEPVDVRVNAHVPIHGPSTIKPPHDICWFESTDGAAIRLVASPQLATQEGFLREAANATTLPELALALQNIPYTEWAWINLFIGKSAERSAPDDRTALDAVQLTDRLLEPLAPWIV